MFLHSISLFAAACDTSKLPKLFGILPTWYMYLPVDGSCQPKLNSLSDIWLIVAAIIEILLRIAALAAVVMIIVSGVMFTTSQGSPEKTAKARSTAINALVGLLISISASLLVGYLAVTF